MNLVSFSSHNYLVGYASLDARFFVVPIIFSPFVSIRIGGASELLRVFKFFRGLFDRLGSRVCSLFILERYMLSDVVWCRIVFTYPSILGRISMSLTHTQKLAQRMKIATHLYIDQGILLTSNVRL